MGIKPQNPIETLRANPNADLLEMSKDLALILVLQYVGIMLPALIVGWWHRRRCLSDYGCTTSGRPIPYHLLTGVVLFAVADLPGKLVPVIDRFVPLGSRAVTQQIAYGLNWGDWKFWILMAVGSFLLVPIVEELFYRGYVQTRLAQDFDAPTAIVITAFFFTFSHGQYYLVFSPWNLGMLLTVLFSALAWGYVFYRTRSLIAPMVAHAAVNFPVRGVGDFVLVAVMFAVVVIYRKQIMEDVRKFGAMFKSGVSSRAGIVLGVVYMTLFAVAVAVAQDVAVLFGAVLLIIALALEFIEKRKLKNTRLASVEAQSA
jgi:membrane protease YdiL (CAAX protease family)